MIQISRKYYDLLYQEDPSKVSSNPRYLAMAKYLKDHEKTEDDEGYRSSWVFMTVNPKPGTTVTQFKKLMVNAMSKKWVGEYAYVYEWRQGTEGLHSHALFMKPHNKQPAQVVREMQNTFKHVVGNPQHVNFKYCYTPDAIIARYKYLYGEKKITKLDKVNNDWDQRYQNDLDNIYESSGFEEAIQKQYNIENTPQAAMFSGESCVGSTPPTPVNGGGGEPENDSAPSCT